MITRLDIVPDYYQGHMFLWDLSQGFPEPRPWRFQVEVSDDGQQRWTPFSPELTDVLQYRHPDRIAKTNKDLEPFYRVRMAAGGRTFYSPVRGVYSSLPRDDYLIAREIMRKELLQMRKMSGVPVKLWKRVRTGTPCTVCTDPVTGEQLRANCPVCKGTRKVESYTGPYDVWASFSPRQQFKKLDNSTTELYGTTDQQVYELRMLGHPFVDS